MNTILRRMMGTGNRLYQVSRFRQPSIISPCVSPLNTFRLLSNNSVDDILALRKMLKKSIAEDPTKSRFIRNNKVTNFEREAKNQAKTVLMKGLLTEEIESGSELPALEVINKVFSILGHSPEIKGYSNNTRLNLNDNSKVPSKFLGERIIFVKLANVDDTLIKLIKDKASLKDYGTLFLEYNFKKNDVGELEQLLRILEQKKTEDPTKRWFIRNNKVTNFERDTEDHTRTVVMAGLLTEEIESGSELPGLEVINKVISILGHSPEIEQWDRSSIKRGKKAGTRLIFVKLIKVDDVQKLVKDRELLKDYGKLSVDIKRSVMHEELKQKMIENPSRHYYIYNGKVYSKAHDSLNKEI